MDARTIRILAAGLYAFCGVLITIVCIIFKLPLTVIIPMSCASIFFVCVAPSFGKSVAYNMKVSAFLEKVEKMDEETFSSQKVQDRIRKFGEGKIPEDLED